MTKPKATPHDDTTDEIAQGMAQNGGPPPSVTLELQGAEVELLYQMLQNGQFGTAYSKQVAASVQMKIEQVAGEQQGNA